MAGWLAGGLGCWLVGWVTACLAGRLDDWLAGWVATLGAGAYHEVMKSNAFS